MTAAVYVSGVVSFFMTLHFNSVWIRYKDILAVQYLLSDDLEIFATVDITRVVPIHLNYWAYGHSDARGCTGVVQVMDCCMEMEA